MVVSDARGDTELLVGTEVGLMLYMVGSWMERRERAGNNILSFATARRLKI